jgi:HD-like signal output (HDOD) protein
MVAAVPEMRGFDLKAFWQGSFRRATYAKGIAAIVPGVAPNTAFTCGLITDFGRLLIRMGDPKGADRIEASVADGGDRPGVERAELGFTSTEVTTELCRRWKFPEVLQRGVAQSAEPMAFPQFETLSAVVHLAEVLCVLKARQASAHEVVDNLPEAVLKALGFGESDIQQIAYRVYESESGLELLAA